MSVLIVWPRFHLVRQIIIIITHKFVCVYSMAMPVYNNYCTCNKAELTRSKQCMLYLYPQLLQSGGVYIGSDVHVHRSGSCTRFTVHLLKFFFF